MNEDLARDFLMEAFPNPERKGCPDESTLRALAGDCLPADHPARLHLGSCSECYAEYRHYQQDLRERPTTSHLSSRTSAPGQIAKRVVMPSSGVNYVNGRRRLWALAAGVAILLGGSISLYRHGHRETAPRVIVASAEPVDASVDLFDVGTLRGAPDGTTPLRQVQLPAALVRLAVTLPRFSDPGDYSIVISKGKAADEVVARASGSGPEQGGRVTVRVQLDLREARPGAYFLSTVQGEDSGSYYYPLQVR